MPPRQARSLLRRTDIETVHQRAAELNALRATPSTVRPPLEDLARPGMLFGAASVALVRWEGVQDEVVVGAAWGAPGTAPVPERSLYHPDPRGPTLRALETGTACNGAESSPGFWEERVPWLYPAALGIGWESDSWPYAHCCC